MKKQNPIDLLTERGFIEQTVYPDDLYKSFEAGAVSYYCGFDPTADSLHIGHYIPVMAMAHLQRCGHKPYIVVGGGTAMVGDPSFKSDMRQMMTRETIEKNVACFKKQLSKFLSFEGANAAVVVDNADWLLQLNYVGFLRDVGAHFSVNKMLTADCFKTRMEKGLSFLEFNYMLMQGYDFLVLNQKYGVTLQVGGNDQWSNILAGADLIRRKERRDAFAMTFKLLLKSDGEKMGKTAKGALWLDPEKTTPYEFYQYFRNVEDAKARECMYLLTFMEKAEIDALTAFNDERLNAAKERLAYEVTAVVHGAAAAGAARAQARAAFSGDASEMPAVKLAVTGDSKIVDILTAAGAAESKGAARRLIEGGGVSVDAVKVASPDCALKDLPGVNPASFVLHKGKKVHLKIEN
ncbi:MAG: tyrosine--tRNA ligase [Clostridiales bacterium]|jgi:tyrosyl-tRNA synthetase|nr:tyrosine--tRNA ligase [Clostridiales bacterium]